MFKKLPHGQARLTVLLTELNTGVIGYKPRSSICDLNHEGVMTIKPGFEWQLPASHFIDEKIVAVPSAVRACIIRLVKMRKLFKKERHAANLYYRHMLVKAGVPLWRRCLHLTGIEPHTYIAAVFRRFS